MQSAVSFDYFYGGESEQFSYYRIPRLLVTGAQFKFLSTDAKLLYGLMLDRMGLSLKNQWYDAVGRVFIYYPLEEIMEALNCGHNKAVRLLAELDKSSGIGLIERVKQGQGKPAIIYVKRFTSRKLPEVCPADDFRLPETGTPDFPKSEVKTSHNQMSRLPESGSTDFPKQEAFIYSKNQTDNSYLYPSIHQSEEPIDAMDRNRCRALVKENIGYIAFSIRDLIRQDIDAIIDQSFTYATFLAALRKNGYEIKSGPNVKHTAVKPPGSSRFIRLSSLGENYTEEAIKRRLSEVRSAPAPVREQTIHISRRKYYSHRGQEYKWKRKPRGFRALYVYYLYSLGFRKPGIKKKYIPIAVRKEVTRLHRYQAQYRLMQEYRIDTDDQLSMLSGAFQSDIDALTERRKCLYKEQRRGGDVSEQIDSINTELRQLRRKLKTCTQIQEDIPKIREQVQVIQQQEKKEQEQDKAKQRKNERRFDPWM